MRKSRVAKKRYHILLAECREAGGHKWETVDKNTGQQRCKHCGYANRK